MSNITYQTPEERHECVFHMRNAWQSGYEDECRQFTPCGSVTEPSIVLQHPCVQNDAEDIDSYVYWSWMDNMTAMAAASEYVAGQWSNWQKDMYLDRHQPQKHLFEQIYSLLSADDCQSVCIMSLFRAVSCQDAGQTRD